MGTFPLDAPTTLFTTVPCFGDTFAGNGITILPPLCDTCGEKGFPPSPVNDSTTTVFPSGPRTLIALGNASPGLRFNTIEVDVGGGFIAICLGCVTDLTREELVKLVGDTDADWPFADAEVND